MAVFIEVGCQYIIIMFNYFGGTVGLKNREFMNMITNI